MTEAVPIGRFGKLLPGLLFAALLGVVYSDPLFVRRNFSGRDLLVYNLPQEKTIHDAYARGRLPVWSPEISGGRPLLPNPNSGALYPVRPMLSLLSFPAAMRIFPLLHWMVAGIGTILLLRALGASQAGAWIGAVTYALSGVVVSEVFYPHIQPGMALLPWTVWVFARRRGSRSGRLIGLSLLFGLLFLAGDVFTSGMAGVACLLWVVVEEDRGEKAPGLVLLALATLLGALIALPQILATALWIPDTNRAVLGMRLRESLFFSVHPLRLLELIVPYPFGMTWNLVAEDVWGWPLFHGKFIGLFTSLYAGAFAVVAVVTLWRSRVRGARFARYLLLLALSACMLPSLIPPAWEAVHSPLPLRNPEKFAVSLMLALAVLSGLAIDRLRAEKRERRWVLVGGGLLGLAALLSAVFPGPAGRLAAFAVGGPADVAVDARRLLPGALAEGGLLWIATAIALLLLGRGTRLATIGSLALLTLVPILANRKVARTLTEQEIFSPTPFARFLDREDPDRAFRTLGESLYRNEQVKVQFAGRADEYTDVGRQLWIYHTPALWGRGMVFNFDFDVGDFSRLESLRRLSYLAARSGSSSAFFGSLALKYGIRLKAQPPISRYQPVGGDDTSDWDRIPGALPGVRLAERWTEKSSALDALKVIPYLGPGDVVLETGRDGTGGSRPGTVRVVRNLPEELIVAVDAPDPSWLFVLRGFWPHRTVEVDGRPVDSVPAQVAFTAVPVTAGKHEVVWRELLPGGDVSRWGPVLCALLLSALVVRDRRAGRERPVR